LVGANCGNVAVRVVKKLLMHNMLFCAIASTTRCSPPLQKLRKGPEQKLSKIKMCVGRLATVVEGGTSLYTPPTSLSLFLSFSSRRRRYMINEARSVVHPH
jgi:hypothetical protein